MNQTLEGHNNGVVCATWNPIFKKLTTSDENGLIIVWILHKGLWYEEMINNRNKSVVRDMKWTSDGKKICIVYEDGAVIVGSVDGNRLWGKELNLPLRFLEWSPDNKMILFVTTDSDVWLYDSDGTKIQRFSLFPFESIMPSNYEYSIVSVSWFASTSPKPLPAFSSTFSGPPPTLCLAFNNGYIMLSRGEADRTPVIFDTELNITFCRWDCSGSIIAVAGGVRNSSKDSKSYNLIKFFDPYGRYLRSLRVPGDSISSFSMEGSGLRIALAVDSFIYFANVRPGYMWCYLQNTLVFSYSRIDKKDSTLFFWDLTSQEISTKIIPNLKYLVSCGEFCANVWCESADRTQASTSNTLTNESSKSKAEEKSSEADSASPVPVKEVYHVQLRNAIGAVVDTKTIPFVPKSICMGPMHIVAANDRSVFVWQFQTQANKVISSSKGSSERCVI